MSKLVLFLAITAMLSYCLGGINGAIITSVNYFKRDVRDFGSGNAGLTNFSRTFGEEHAALVLVVDIAKTILAVLFGGWLLGHLGLADVGRLFAGFCTIIGHIYPPYYGFQGGMINMQSLVGAMLAALGITGTLLQLLMTPLNIAVAAVLYASFYPAYVSVFRS